MPAYSRKRLFLAVFILVLALLSLVFLFQSEDESLPGDKARPVAKTSSEAQTDAPAKLDIVEQPNVVAKPEALTQTGATVPLPGNPEIPPATAVAGKPPLISPEGLVFEESLSPTLADNISQGDFAIDETLRRLAMPSYSLYLADEELRDEQGSSYRYRHLQIYAGKNVPLFVNTLRNCLLAWAEDAQLLHEIELADSGVEQEQKCQNGQKEPNEQEEQAALNLNIVMQGVVTHSLSIYAEGSKLPDGLARAGAADKDGTEAGFPATGLDEIPDGSSPMLVIVLDDLGESPRQARLLLDLDYPVTFAIWPQSTHARAVALAAADKGREVIIHQPMEPIGYPEVSPGGGALLYQMPDEQIISRLKANLALVPGASGMNNHMGSWLTQSGRAMELVAGELKKRDMLVLDSLTHQRSQLARVAKQMGLKAYQRDIFLDVQPDKNSVLAQLKRAEQIAILRGQSIAIGHPLPGTLEALQEWQTLRNPKVRLVCLRDLAP